MGGVRKSVSGAPDGQSGRRRDGGGSPVRGRIPYPAVWLSFGVVSVMVLAWMFSVESFAGHEELYRFTTDAKPDRWLGVVTTATVSLLFVGAAFHVAGAVFGPRDDRAIRRFHAGQAAVVAWLALDDRLQIHEEVGGWITMRDAVVMAAYACVVVVLLAVAPRRARRGAAGQLLLATALAFGVMSYFDAMVDEDRFGQLAVEESFKVSGILMLTLYCVLVTVQTIRESGVEAAREREMDDILSDGERAAG